MSGTKGIPVQEEGQYIGCGRKATASYKREHVSLNGPFTARTRVRGKINPSVAQRHAALLAFMLKRSLRAAGCSEYHLEDNDCA